jgi:RNA polymerase sigma-70 factor (ECF subfamily)
MSAATPISLLDRLRSCPDAGSWNRLVELYTPLIRDWLCHHDLQRSDVEDLVQEVLGAVVLELPNFEHNQRPGAFRSWLKMIAVHRLRYFWRTRQAQPQTTSDPSWSQQLNQLEDPTSDLSQRWDQEHDRYIVTRLMKIIQPEFEPTTWQAFCRVVLDGVKPAAAAEELGISVNAVCIAKSRVLNRLRQEGSGLID